MDDGSYGSCNIDDFQRLIQGRADADAARLRIFDTVWCLPLLTERTSLRGGDTASYLDMAERSTEISAEGLRLAVLRLADEKATHDPAVGEEQRVDVRRRRVNAELEQGQLVDALAALPTSPEHWPRLTEAFSLPERRAIAGAYFLQGDEARARQWLATALAQEAVPPKESAYERSQREGRAYRLELLKRSLDGHVQDDFEFLARWFEFKSEFVNGQNAVWQPIFNRLAEAQGYPGLASPSPRLDSAGKRQAMEACYRCAPELMAMIERIAEAPARGAQRVGNAVVGPQLPQIVRERMDRVLASPRPAWSEHPLPADLRTKWAAEGAPEADMFSARAARRDAVREPWMERLPAGALVRYERTGQRITAITASQSLDPTGEISAGGYWVSVSDDGGKSFAAPLYTGLRMYAPYVVMRGGRLPMVEGDRIRLEVAVRKLDDGKVMLPPISLPFLEQRQDLYVETTLAELARDGDGDGLTDLAEWGMMLAPDVADTDGDGLEDGRDPLPHVAVTTSIRGAGAMAAALNEVFGKEMGAIVTTDAADSQPGRTYAIGPDTDTYNASSTRFMAAPPAYFAGLSLSQRVIVLDPAQIDRLSKARGLSFAMGIETFEVSHDGNLALMVWSSGWAGGTLLLKRQGEGWTIEPLQSWIT